MMDFEWDVAVVGAGMAGAALGYQLARAGHKVVFLEKGAGRFTTDGVDEPHTINPTRRMEQGRWPVHLSGLINGEPTSFFPPLGCGAGGSTLLYSATLERFSPSDFGTKIQGPKGEAGWPITYDELAPYYLEAERLLKVRGGAPPLGSTTLREPTQMNMSDRHFFSSLQANGLNPYRLPIGFEAMPECLQCGGMICPKNCKSDARTTFIEPALASGNAQLFDFCTVDHIDATDEAVTSLSCNHKGKSFALKARIYVLAAGALSTPVLMLNSTSRSWPNGLANSSGMIGRNLMFHATDFFAVWPKQRFNRAPPKKTIGVRDFYQYRGVDLGSIQSTGLNANYRNILHFLRTLIEAHRFRSARLLKPFLRVPAAMTALLLGKATVFSTILTDRPYHDNCVVPDPSRPGGMRFEYTIRSELVERVKLLRELCREAFRGHRMMIIPSEVNLNFGHSCGTCRFGSDPDESVLDANNRTHDLSNLYVADASFFPTSGGTNPSLTIAANALRVADHISEKLRAPCHPVGTAT
jgi:choline dehydrogenase-like flavoprotein